MFQAILQRVIEGHHLTADEVEQAMNHIMTGGATPAQIGAYLAVLRLKGETVDEIVGSARAMRAHVTTVTTAREGLVDTCGTGGDGCRTFNISTVAALVVAACDVPVAKHGNRSVSSRCGSADVLEALGVRIDLPAGELGACLDEVGIAFLFAPRLHPAIRHAVGPRRELGVPTIFNVLGPLTNPAGAKYQLMGVYDPALVEPLANVLRELGARRALVVHGSPGLDEISICGPTRIAHVAAGGVRVETFEPADAGLETAPVAALAGGDERENAAIARRIFAGEPGPPRDAVLLNAAGALLAAGVVGSLREGVERAADAIDSGRAAERLAALVRFTRSRSNEEAAG